MSEAKQLKLLFEETRRELALLKPWQKTNRVPLATRDSNADLPKISNTGISRQT